jgi:hypothetical protein
MNPDKIADRVSQKFDEHARRNQLRETYSQRLVMFYNGGMFKITPELFAMLSVFQDVHIILQDGYNNPVLVNRKDMLAEAKSRYCELMNDWHNDFNNTNK